MVPMQNRTISYKNLKVPIKQHQSAIFQSEQYHCRLAGSGTMCAREDALASGASGEFSISSLKLKTRYFQDILRKFFPKQILGQISLIISVVGQSIFKIATSTKFKLEQQKYNFLHDFTDEIMNYKTLLTNSTTN